MNTEKLLRKLYKNSIATSEGCREWLGAKTDAGYGRIHATVASGIYKSWYTHRLMFFIHNQYLPTVVMHTCDNPACIEITHLQAGTYLSNAQDRDSKGRNGSSKNRGSKYDYLVEDIRGLHNLGWGPKLISEHYDIPKPSVEDILYKKG